MKKPSRKTYRCSNCGKEIIKVGIMSPTLNEKQRNMCISCVKKLWTLDLVDSCDKWGKQDFIEFKEIKRRINEET